MAKRRIRSTDKQPRVYVPGDFTSERGSRLGAVRTSGAVPIAQSPSRSTQVVSNTPTPDLGLKALAFQDDAPIDGTPYERQDGAWVAASAGSGIADGDYGDITVSGGGTAMSIDPDAVTYAMMPDLATGEVYGSEAGGNPEPIAVSAPLFISSGKLGSNAITLDGLLGTIALGVL